MEDIEYQLCLYLKFGECEYMERLYKEGEIYMQSIEYYKSYEHLEIGDSAEGMDILIQKPKLTLQIPELNFEYEIKTATHITYGQIKPQLHLYCMTGITQSYLLSKVNSDNKVHLKLEDFGNFGNTVCIIKDVPKFHRRFEQVCQNDGYKLIGPYKVVYYSSTEYSGDLFPYHKRDIYKHQEEFRYFVKAKDEAPICLKMGSLKDIAELCTIDGKLIL